MAPISILIINPNTIQSMTDALKPLVESLGYTDSTYTYFTTPTSTSPSSPLLSSAPSSINSPHDALLSAHASWPHLLPLLPSHSAYLVACYSPHPLVRLLRKELAGTGKPVLGIFEASVCAAVQLLDTTEEDEGDGEEGGKEGEGKEVFGIVSTGKIWEEVLEEGVKGMMLSRPFGRFAGVETTGLSAVELHHAPREEVEERVKRAARRLVKGKGADGGVGERRGKVKVVILGCAGMAGMEGWVREEVGEGVRVVDGVKASVGALQGLIRGRF